jgi:membrane protein YqaA with SNARE-associated domain
MVRTLPSPAVRSEVSPAPVEMSDSAARGGWLRHVSALSNHRYSTWLLAAIAFADSSFLPIPPDLLLVPMILFRPERVRLLLVICTVASSLGAALGYLIGYGLWNVIGQPLVDFYGYADGFAAYQRLVDNWGVWIIIAKAFTPLPFKIAAIAAGVAAMNPVSFMLASIFGRALHFVMVGALLMLCGARILALVERYERPFAVISVLVLIGLIVAFHLS